MMSSSDGYSFSQLYFFSPFFDSFSLKWIKVSLGSMRFIKCLCFSNPRAAILVSLSVTFLVHHFVCLGDRSQRGKMEWISYEFHTTVSFEWRLNGYALFFQVAVFHLEFSKEQMPSQAQHHLVPHSRWVARVRKQINFGTFWFKDGRL